MKIFTKVGQFIMTKYLGCYNNEKRICIYKNNVEL